MNDEDNERDTGNIQPDGEFSPKYFQEAAEENFEPKINLGETEDDGLDGSGNVENWIVRSTNPTEEATEELVFAFDYFNQHLFGGVLPGCLITLVRKPGSLGSYSPDRFSAAEQRKADWISLNPSHFHDQSIREVFVSLVHQMGHCARRHCTEGGKTKNPRYHDRGWASIMKAVGLMPSSTGLKGGSETGYHVRQYVIKGGPFDRVADALIREGFSFTWKDQLSGIKNKKASKPGFCCPGCHQTVWGKPDSFVICGNCRLPMLRSDEPSKAAPHRSRNNHQQEENS